MSVASHLPYIGVLMFHYAVEILPYGLRAKGFAIMVKPPVHRCTAACLFSEKNLFIQIALAFDQFVNPVALDMIGWKYVGGSFHYCGFLAC